MQISSLYRWILFGGNAMLALDWVTFANSMVEVANVVWYSVVAKIFFQEAARKHMVGEGKKIGFLLLDYPGEPAHTRDPDAR